jgi:hypothetical protein
MRWLLLRAGGFVAGVLLVVESACGRGGSGPRPASDGSPPPQPAASVASGSGSHALQNLVLQADLQEQPSAWTEVMLVPFGEGPGRLGYRPSSESAPVEPSSFAVAQDGSFWIVDPGHSRVVHYSGSGTYLGAVTGVGARVADVAFAGDLMYVLEDQTRGRVAVVGADGVPRSTTVTQDGHTLYVRALVALRNVMLAEVGGYASKLQSGPHGLSRLDLPGSGEATPIPGLPVGPDTWMRLDVAGDQDFEIHYVGAGATSVQPIQVQVVAGRGTDPQQMAGVVGPGIEVAFDHAAGFVVAVSPSRPEDAGKFGGGRWFLRLGPDGSPLIWERLSQGRIPDESQVRHVALGPDGSVYLMVAERVGVRILRR